jgi:hypothetical protein
MHGFAPGTLVNPDPKFYGEPEHLNLGLEGTQTIIRIALGRFYEKSKFRPRLTTL